MVICIYIILATFFIRRITFFFAGCFGKFWLRIRLIAIVDLRYPFIFLAGFHLRSSARFVSYVFSPNSLSLFIFYASFVPFA